MSLHKGLRLGRKLSVALGLMGMVFFTAPHGYAATHSSYNPMQPRQLSLQASQADYTYGYSILAGHAIDTLDEPNRMMWYLNYDILDYYIVGPVAHVYGALPRGVQDAMGHFFSNLDEINNVPNNMLIGEFGDAASSAGRFVVNSTIGLLGFFDVATSMGLDSHPMGMDTVLGKAGMETGSYIMMPAYGPTTARDVNASMIDGIPWFKISFPITFGKGIIRGLHNRAQLIPQEDFLRNSFDPYITARDAFLMNSDSTANPVQEGVVENEDNFDEDLLDEIDG